MRAPEIVSRLCVCVLVLAAGCSDPDRRSNAEPSAGSRALSDSPGEKDDIFQPPRVLEISIEITPPRLEELRHQEDSHAYVRCSVREGDRSWDEVGIHCRGNPAKELATGKPDWIVTFDKYVSGQRFHGERRIILQSSRDDPSYLAAPVALELFQAAGVPAVRCSFARVQFNDRPLGLYVVIEGVEREFLERHFRKTDGNLYDEGHPPDVTGKLEKARGRDRKDQSDVDALAAAALHPNPEERWKQLQQRLDITRFLNFTAVEVLLWQDDSYSLEAGKFRLYHDPASDRFVFFPKCVERVLRKTTGPIVPDCRGVVARAVLNTKEGEQQYRDALAKLLQTEFQPAKVRRRVETLAALIRPVLTNDNPGAAKEFDQSVARFLEAVDRRVEFAAAQLKAPAGK